MIYNETLSTIPLNDYKKVCGSCTLYIVLFAAHSLLLFLFAFIVTQKRILPIPITSTNDNFQTK